MNEMSAGECAEIKRFQQVYNWIYYNHNKRMYDVSDADIKTLTIAASVLRKVASGELVEVSHGEWERMINPYGELEGFMCKCGHQDTGATKYCCECGAKMDISKNKKK